MTQESLVEISYGSGAETGVVTLFLNRPGRRNALDSSLMRALAGALDQIRDDPNTRVVVLRGRGPVFSSGVDHGLLLQVATESQKVPFAHLHRDLQEVFHRIEKMERPVIAVLHRACVGMALELALACDLRLCTADCALGLPEIAFGIVPDVGGTTRLVRAVGYQRAKALILTGRILSARTAEREGLYGLMDEVHEDLAALEGRLSALCTRLLSFSPVGLGKAKSLLRYAAECGAAQSFELEGLTQELLIRQPDLGERFPAAVQLIRAGIENPD